MEVLINFLKNKKIDFNLDFDLTCVSPAKIGGRARLAIFPKTENQLLSLLNFCLHKKIFYKIIGNASNLLFFDKIDFPLIFTTAIDEKIKIEGNIVSVSAGYQLQKFCDDLKKHSLSGLEGLCGIPATVGGAIVNHAGAFGYQISDKLVSIKVFNNGKIYELKKDKIKFCHHYSNLKGLIILSACFLFEKKEEYDIMNLCMKYSFLRSKTQPIGYSLGSTYKKVGEKSAGFYIERCGLKGYHVGGLAISRKHANFFINDGTASALDFLRLDSIVKQKVLSQFGVELSLEIEKVGEKI